MTDDGDEGWDAGEQALRRLYPGVTLHIMERLRREPPYRFRYWLSPDCQETALIHRGRRMSGGGLEELERYLRDIRFVDRPEFHGAIQQLLDVFKVRPPTSHAARPWSEASQNSDLMPRVLAGDGTVRVFLSYIDERPLHAAHREGRARRVVEATSRCDEIELACKVERFTLEISRDGQLVWNKESFERTVVRRYQVPASKVLRRWVRIVAGMVALAACVAYALFHARC